MRWIEVRTMKRPTSLLVAGVLLAACAHASSPASPPPAPDAPVTGASQCARNESPIGVATMRPDGALVLNLRTGPPGPMGEAQMVYLTTHEDYGMIQRHVGAMRPGESRPVCPFE